MHLQPLSRRFLLAAALVALIGQAAPARASLQWQGSVLNVTDLLACMGDPQETSDGGGTAAETHVAPPVEDSDLSDLVRAARKLRATSPGPTSTSSTGSSPISAVAAAQALVVGPQWRMEATQCVARLAEDAALEIPAPPGADLLRPPRMAR